MSNRLRLYLVYCLLAGSLGAASPPAPAAAAPAAAPAARRPDLILLIGIDCLRADHLGAYGYFRDTTPAMDAYIGDAGVVFTNTSSTSTWTFPSSGAAATGLAPFRMGLGWYPYDYPLPASAVTLAEYLQQNGYHTAGFVTNFFLSHYANMQQGFDHMDETMLAYPHQEPGWAGLLTDRVIDYAQQLTQTSPLFLFTWYLDPHTWYNPAPPYDLFYDPVYTGTLTPTSFGDGDPAAVQSPRDLEHLIALYDGEISYADEHIGRLLSFLQKRGMLDNALVVMYADHGEHFNEHNLYTHGNSDYEELVRVPLMVRYTGVITGGRSITAPVQTTDILPTILDYAGIAIPPGLDGASLRPWLETNPPPGVRPIYTEVVGVTDPDNWAYGHAPRFDLRSVRLGDWKYIQHYRDAANDELYLLDADSPYETENLILLEPERAAAMRRMVESYFMLHRSYLPAAAWLAP